MQRCSSMLENLFSSDFESWKVGKDKLPKVAAQSLHLYIWHKWSSVSNCDTENVFAKLTLCTRFVPSETLKHTRGTCRRIKSLPRSFIRSPVHSFSSRVQIFFMFEADKPLGNIRMKKYERMDAFGVSAIYFIVIILDERECVGNADRFISILEFLTNYLVCKILQNLYNLAIFLSVLEKLINLCMIIWLKDIPFLVMFNRAFQFIQTK